MKKILIILSLSLFTSLSLSAQKIHSFSEILKMMTNSPVNYEIQKLNAPIPVPERSKRVNLNYVYRVKNGNSMTVYKYSINEKAKPYLKKAEKYFGDKDFLNALESYRRVLELDSAYYQVITYIGQVYDISGNRGEAIEWYKKAIQKNYIDYMAHWFLADDYLEKGEIQKAVDEITVAKILNRNNARIQSSLQRIYRVAKLDSKDWTFNPQMKIDSIGPNKIEVASDRLWLPYTLVTAFWRYEPGYSESMGAKRGELTTDQSKEALVALISALKKKDYRKNPEFKALQLAINNKMITEFILYEIWLPRYPQVAYQLSRSTVNDIKKYVISIRGEKLK